jgi:tripartite-type tricarboxylate transporter receptor subunit TctC
MHYRRLGVLILAVVGLQGSAFAQSWPSKPIRAIVPFTAGSASDIIARTAMEQLSIQLNQTIVVENRVGAGGTIGAAVAAKADADGYTLLVDATAHTATPFLYKNLPFDMAKDFAAVAPIASLPQVLVISPDKGIASAAELVAAAKAKPGTITYASGGIGSTTHLNAERFRLSAGFTGIHVPFRGGPEGLREVMTGRVDFYFVPVLPALPFINEGKLAALAVSTAKRASLLPSVPTTLEAGYRDSEFNYWVGIFVPASTPRDVIQRLNQETVKAVQAPEMAAKLAKYGAEPMVMNQAEFDAFVAGEFVQGEKLIKTLGITAN